MQKPFIFCEGAMIKTAFPKWFTYEKVTLGFRKFMISEPFLAPFKSYFHFYELFAKPLKISLERVADF
jgi:hypothetical protein